LAEAQAAHIQDYFSDSCCLLYFIIL